MTKLALLTSGGDAPGMNPAIRAIVRTAVSKGLEVIGIRCGYAGLMDGDFVPLDSRSVSNIMHLGGTVLHTRRAEEFKNKEGRARAAAFLERAKVDYLVPIGGNGTLCGSLALGRETSARIVHVPSTIDNDVCGTDYTIGFDTAVNTALEAIDRIRDTAVSAERLFFVEVMGRDAGFIALESGIAGGATGILVPEITESIADLCQHVEDGFRQGKKSSIIVVAEGDRPGGAFEVAREVKARIGIESRVCILGHVQRGGSPTARDRVLATRFGVAAVEALVEGQSGIMVGEVGGQIVPSPINQVAGKRKPLNNVLVELLRVVSG